MLRTTKLKILLDASIIYKHISDIRERELLVNDYIRKRGISEEYYFIEERNTWEIRKNYE